MSNLTRWDPFREMANFRRAVNRVMGDQYYTPSTDWDQTMNWDLPLDVVEKPGEYIIKASLPGINPDDLDITYNNNMLTIRGETKMEDEHKDGQYLLQERHYGSYQRSISLPQTINVKDIEANYQNGVLTLTLPKSEEMKPKRISVKVDQGQRSIEAKAHETAKR